jgi:hypothetical protein
MSTNEKVIACSLGTADRTQRADRWRSLGDYDVEQLADGLRLVFTHDVASELEALAVLEAGCCAFADWKADGNTIDITAATAEAIAAVKALGF